MDSVYICFIDVYLYSLYSLYIVWLILYLFVNIHKFTVVLKFWTCQDVVGLPNSGSSIKTFVLYETATTGKFVALIQSVGYDANSYILKKLLHFGYMFFDSDLLSF